MSRNHQTARSGFTVRELDAFGDEIVGSGDSNP